MIERIRTVATSFNFVFFVDGAIGVFVFGGGGRVWGERNVAVVVGDGGVATVGFGVAELFVEGLFPRPEAAGVREVHEDAKAFVGGDDSCEADVPEDGGEDSIPTAPA